METKQLHPLIAQLQTFLSDAFTEGEFVARTNAVLTLVNHDFILEAAEQIKAYRASQQEPEVQEVKPE